MAVFREEFAKVLLALQFLTRLPIPKSLTYTQERFADTSKYYPLIGMFIGFVCAVFYLLAAQIYTQALAVALMTGVGVLLTGAFHEDGLADTFDGIGGGQTREKALSIMKDSRLGTYGTLALGLVLLCKVVTLISLPAHLLVVALVAGHGLSRLSSVLVIASSSYARDHGTAKPVSAGISQNSLGVALSTGVVCVLLVLIFVSVKAAVATCMGVGIGHWLMRALYSKKLGGYTGDTLGAVQQLSELGFYLGLAAWA